MSGRLDLACPANVFFFFATFSSRNGLVLSQAIFRIPGTFCLFFGFFLFESIIIITLVFIQMTAWSNFQTKSLVKSRAQSNPKKKMVAVIIAVRLCSYLFSSRWSKRPKVVVLFASQSGRAENFAMKAFVKFKSLFQANVKEAI